MSRFSILIPVYNVEAYLGECLESVLGQTCPDCEVIAVDDGSTDCSGEIAEQYKERFADSGIPYRVIHQSNAGLSAARNTAIDSAAGDYLLFLDSDDWIAPETLEVLNRRLHGEDMLCFNGQRYFESTRQTEPADSFVEEHYDRGWDYYRRHVLEQRNFAFVCVVLRCYRRQFILDHGLTFRPGLLHEDNLFTPQVCRYAKAVGVTPDVLYYYRVRGDSIMTRPDLRKRADMIRIANELSNTIGRDETLEKTEFYRFTTRLYQSVFIDNSRREDRELLPLVDWKAYRRVSRTKMRHRVLYRALRHAPGLYRLELKMIEKVKAGPSGKPET